jgi:hypothetical protein
MITTKIKANAIALLKLGNTVQEVSEELDIPYMLVKEWESALDIRDLTSLQANANALTMLVEGEVMNSSEDNINLLKTKIEEAALKIVDAVSKEVKYPDMIQAKALNLLADTCSKLYNTVINKGQVGFAPSSGVATLTMFEQMSKD